MVVCLGGSDHAKTAAGFRDVLGFRISWEDADEWRLAQRDDVPPAQLRSHNWFGYIEVDDVDAFHAELVARGAACSAPADRPYGMHGITVTTVDGHRIVFADERQASTA